MKFLSVVKLRHDLPEHGLLRGARGSIVMLFDFPSRTYEVECVDAQGSTLAEVALREEELEEVAS